MLQLLVAIAPVEFPLLSLARLTTFKAFIIYIVSLFSLPN